MKQSYDNRPGPAGSRVCSPRLTAWATLLVLAALFIACGRAADQSLKHAAEAWDSGDYEAAAKDYEQYLRGNPTGGESLEARFQLANVYYLNLNRYEQARVHYREFLNQEPTHENAAVARERLAEVLTELGQSYEAIAEYENINPEGVTERRRIRLLIADLYFDQKNFNQALAEYSKVTEGSAYDELSERAYQREASIYHISRGQYQQAIPAYQKMASESRDPEVRLRALYAIADCYAGLYLFDEAVKTLREIKEEGEQAYIRRRVSELEQQKREAAQARSGIQR